MEKVTLSADVYEVHSVGDIRYLWDFEAFSCVGTEEHPTALVSPADVVRLGLGENGGAWNDGVTREAVEATLYSFEYALFALSSPSNATAVEIDGEVYRITTRASDIEETDNWVVLDGASRYSDERVVRAATLDKKLHRGSWLPLVELDNGV